MPVDRLVLMGGLAAGTAVWCIWWLFWPTRSGRDVVWPRRQERADGRAAPLGALREFVSHLRTGKAREPTIDPAQLARFVERLLWGDRLGLPLQQALQSAAERTGQPFARTSEDVDALTRVGVPLSRALDERAERAPPDLARLLRVLALLAGEWRSGSSAGSGHLRDLRDRLRAEAQVQAQLRRELAGLRANTRVVVLVLPGLVLLAFMTNPGLLRPLLSDPAGRIMGALAIVIFGGMLVAVRQLSRISV